jgi:xanthine/CO dehydrogenase XdhC/CoxF family maturation factor
LIHRKETAEVLGRLAELEAAGRRAALATVVRIAGSAYRRPGAKFLVEESGDTLGSVSGGCLEADVREVARGVLAGGAARLLQYDTGSGDETVWGLGLGCEGQVEVSVQAATEGPLAEAAPRLREILAGEDALAVATVLEENGSESGAPDHPILLLPAGGAAEGSLSSAELDRLAAETARRRIASGRSGVETVGGRRVFFDVLQAPRHLLILGAGDDARPLAAYAADAGFRVTVADHRPALLAPGRFPEAPATVTTVRARPEEEPPPELARILSGEEITPRAMAVVMTHSLAHDREWVRRLLAAGLAYVGVLGPRARTGALLAELEAEDDPRVFAPVGLDLGADGPHQVAFAVVAELLAVLSGREPRHLAERREAIHAG